MSTIWDHDTDIQLPRRSWRGAGLVVVIVLLASLLWGVSSYNRLVSGDQAVRAQWAQVENVYQRRLDLVPNLVSTVQGAASFERGTLLAVTEARALAAQTPAHDASSDPAALARYQQAQAGLSSALSRMMVVVERYPELRATENFRDLQSQLEGTENRITVERMRFNDLAASFNARRGSFPTVLVAGMFGARFRDKPYFAADPAARVAPHEQF